MTHGMVEYFEHSYDSVESNLTVSDQLLAIYDLSAGTCSVFDIL